MGSSGAEESSKGVEEETDVARYSAARLEAKEIRLLVTKSVRMIRVYLFIRVATAYAGTLPQRHYERRNERWSTSPRSCKQLVPLSSV